MNPPPGPPEPEPQPQQQLEPTRVAIIGGGVAGLFAALALSDPALAHRDAAPFEITVYTRGWRLGGKCASGRNPAHHHRIEEHGLHLWFGFYRNALRWTRRLLDDQVGELPPDRQAVHQRFDGAFEGLNEVILYEEWPDHLQPEAVSALRLRFPHDAVTPASAPPAPPTVSAPSVVDDRDALEAAEIPNLGATVRRVGEVLALTARLMFADATTLGPTWCFARLVGIGVRLGVKLVPRNLGEVPGEKPGLVTRARLRLLLGLLKVASAVSRPVLGPESGRGEGRRRQLFVGLDLLTAALRGLQADRLLELGFGTIDDRELRQWLADHGARSSSLSSGSVLWALYDLVFAYHRGNTGVPELAAGRGLAALLRLLGGYHQQFGYRMTSSMGEVVLAPLYEVARQRGVHFAFFRDLRAVALEDRGGLASVTLHRQAEVATDGWDPFAWAGPHRPAHWCSEPDWRQAGLDPERVSAEELENGMAEDPSEPREVLRVGVDVDHVILAVPAPVLADRKELFDPLVQAPGWREMFAHQASVATVAYQVWSSDPAGSDGLAAPDDPGGNGLTGRLNDRFGVSVVSSYDQPFSTYCPMDQVAAVEGWSPAGPPVRIGYGCGVWPEPFASVEDAEAEIERRAGDSLQYLDVLPDPPRHGVRMVRRTRPVVPPPRPVAAMGGVLWTRLNHGPAQQYITTPPKNPWYRLDPERSGIDRLWIAGDWTANLVDGGCVEAAVISALRAVRGLTLACGVPSATVESALPVLGERSWLAHGGRGGPAPAAEQDTDGPVPSLPADPVPPNRVGALTSVRGPYESADTTLFSWLVRIDPDRAQRLARRCFEELTGGEVKVEPVGSLAMITVGEIGAVSSLASGWDRLGQLSEKQVVIWLPSRVRWPATGADADADAPEFAMFVPFVWVDNPMSLTTGREGLGWPKALADFGPDLGLELPVSISVYGLDRYQPQNRARANQPLLAITPDPLDDPGEFLDQVIDTADLTRRLLGAAVHSVGLGAGAALGAMIDALRTGALPELFSKALIAPEDQPAADFLQVVTASAVIGQVHEIRPVGPCQLVVHDVASHPLVSELGLVSQALPFGFRVHLDFVQSSGRVRWSNWTPPDAIRGRADGLAARRRARRHR